MSVKKVLKLFSPVASSPPRKVMIQQQTLGDAAKPGGVCWLVAWCCLSCLVLLGAWLFCCLDCAG